MNLFGRNPRPASDPGPLNGLAIHRSREATEATDECIGPSGTAAVLRVTTLKGAGPAVVDLIDYYAGLA